MKRTDFYTMLYQFIAVAAIFFFSIKKSFSDPLTAKIIYPLEFVGIDVGFTPGLLIMNSILFLGVFGLIVQRKIYVNQEIKKEIGRKRGK